AQYTQVLKVLEEIKAHDIPRIVVLNKIDRIKDDDVRLSHLETAFPGALKVSAHTGEGFEELLSRMKEILLGSLENYIVPSTRADLVELVRKNGTIESEEWLDDGVHLNARIPGTIDEEGNASTRTLSLLMPYMGILKN
ncbi:MAG TPA: GTPase HflX, partial [Treponema sp.]|nr:GTPase HflX [Treponema sp.]